MTLPPAKEVLAEAEVGAGGLYKLWLRITRILETQDKHAKLLEAQAAEIASLREAVLTLQAREDGVIARAERAAVEAAAQATNETSRRIGFLEAITQSKGRS